MLICVRMCLCVCMCMCLGREVLTFRHIPPCPHLKAGHIHSHYLMIVTLHSRPTLLRFCLHSRRNEVLLGVLINHSVAPAVQSALDRLQQPCLQIVSQQHRAETPFFVIVFRQMFFFCSLFPDIAGCLLLLIIETKLFCIRMSGTQVQRSLPDCHSTQCTVPNTITWIVLLIALKSLEQNILKSYIKG